MKQLFAVLALALIIGVGPIIKKFSYGENFHPEYDSRVPTAFMEIGKLIISYGYVISERKAGKSIWRECMDIWTLSPVSYLLKFCIPAIFYALTNNLTFVLLELEAPAELVLLWNFKVVATTFLLSFWLKRKYTSMQYLAIFTLVLGIMLTQISHFKNESNTSKNPSSSTTPTVSESQTKFGIEKVFGVMLGPSLTIIGATVTAFTNVYCEHIYKQKDTPVYDQHRKYDDSFWMKNVKLYTFGAIVNLGSFFMYELKQNKPESLFHGFNIWVYITILTGCTSGLLISIIMKIVDNIAIIHADGIGTVLTTILSIIYFHLVLDFFFVTGGIIIIGSIYLFHSNKLNNLACFKIAGRKYESLSTNASINNDGDETTVVVTKFSDSDQIENKEKNLEEEEDDSTEETPLIV